MQISQGSPKTVSMSEPDSEFRAMLAQAATCNTPQWPPATAKMKTKLSSRPIRINTSRSLLKQTDCARPAAREST